MKLLQDIIVADFSQFLSGPSAGLRLADMGAEVIKIERPGTGDICRHLYVSDTMVEGESTIFHAINRNKESYAADLKEPLDLAKIKTLLRQVDVLLHNFRPGVMERLGLDYETVKAINPGIVYAEISGFGAEGPWAQLPGQDLLVQAASGLAWLSGSSDAPPTPMGVAIVDIMAGTHLAQGILAALYRRGISGEGSLVQVSMLESILDFQFEVLTCHYNDGRQLPQRSAVNGAHAYVAAPYGIYQTGDGFLALAMGDIQVLARLLACPGLEPFAKRADWFSQRDAIKAVLASHLSTQATQHWLDILQPADIWCAPVLNYEQLMAEPAYRELQIEQEVRTTNGLAMRTTRCPFRVDGALMVSEKGAPLLGEHNEVIEARFGLQEG